MNKFIFTLIMVLSFTAFSAAQEDEKIKGDRNVTIKQTYIDPFKKIIVGEDFSVEIIYNSRPSVEIEADSNLHEYILFEVINGTLTFKTTKRITSSRRMNIKVNYAEGLESIEVKEDGEIRSLTSLELKNTTLVTSGSSRAYLNIKTNDFNYTALDKAKVKLNVNANNAVITLNDNVKMEALLNAKTAKFDLYQRATANVEGTLTTTELHLDNSSTFNGKEFLTTTCTIIADMNSAATIRVNDTVTIEATGNSEVYLYNAPKITLPKFVGTVKLQMKE
ncbi:putative autotransporter adhesin-like protein [Gelidibacter sediminis]|uniref:Putative autotransporter adhesin-like protein n=1 Tax=Gelidibacter sediminis TaxID=1608710 RepID=A0A4V3F899_9FLAO|nr:DUF2807 domain-containing protein [Gelidibacter sediminis]TDU39576.1 putative autotransporter adhesin-like protein [Gelidibacter sediminis]